MNMKTVIYIGFFISILINLLLISKLVKNNDTSLTVAEDGISINYAFSGLVNDPKTLLLETIDAAVDTLDIAIYNFEDREIAEAVLQAKKRGVVVRVITDADKAEKKNNASILDILSDNGIEVKLNQVQKMHLKIAIIDENMILTGSYNFTKASANKNQEQLMTIQNTKIAEEWIALYEKLWNSSNYTFWR